MLKPNWLCLNELGMLYRQKRYLHNTNGSTAARNTHDFVVEEQQRKQTCHLYSQETT